MEFKILGEKIREEARRVSRAFGGESFRREADRSTYMFVAPLSESASMRYSIDGKTQQLEWIELSQGKRRRNWDGDAVCWLDFSEVEPTANAVDGIAPELNAILACGLYRLGIEEGEAWDELNLTLTAHEQLELRLGFPREFWPQKWLDEAVQ
ncbi:hypothetical protein EON83_26030 [bacterium]|nr:MAG: hypothetical protein EON83_26030 [bacterium]